MILTLLACADPTSAAACLSERGHLEGPDELVYDLAWSPRDLLLLVGGLETLRLVEVDDSGRHLTVWQQETNSSRFNSVMWSADGDHAVVPTGTEVRILRVDRDQRSFQTVATSEALPAELQRGMLSPDERHLLTCDVEGAVQLHAIAFDPPSVTLLDSLPVHTRCTRVSWSPSGLWASSAGKEGLLPLIAVDGDEGTLTLVSQLQFDEESAEVVWSPLGDEALVAGTFGEINELYVLERVDQTLHIRSTNSDHQSGVGALAFNRAGTRLLTGDHDHTLRLFEVGEELELLDTLPTDGRGVHSARWSYDERFIARTTSQFVDHVDVVEVQDPCVGN